MREGRTLVNGSGIAEFIDLNAVETSIAGICVYVRVQQMPRDIYDDFSQWLVLSDFAYELHLNLCEQCY